MSDLSDLLSPGGGGDEIAEDARSTAGSERSTSSARSGIPKFSGSQSRPGSRIGQATGASSKFALPPTGSSTPKKSSSFDYAQRISEDILQRYRLTDVEEMEEYEEDFFGNRLHTVSPSNGRYRKSSDFWDSYPELDFFGNPLHVYPPRPPTSLGSTATTSSMDALWDLHPRKLSEAGLSRHSDNSTVLTEDTDSFIIGQRVWVGGSKPGQIAYIGETQFAPGEWAGIVLDQPIGKNDGSVGGIRYFQCESKKGVFSRLTRLTRYPMTDSVDCTTPSPTNGTRRSVVSPSMSTRSALSVSNTSLASTFVDFKVGERVIIKSSQGSKIGTLRYMGFTSFANGEWCGVELDEPRGKNDGSVEGKRYFECRPNFGLFAPVSKVSRSPSNRKPRGNCALHNSRESLLSLSSITSATSTARRVRLGVTSLTPKKTPPKMSSTPLPSRQALQEVLKEKQQHIEQLLKERDLERAEITRAASQTDDAEQKHATIKSEFEQYRSQCDNRFKECSMLIEELKNERNTALGQLDDERRKNEDLQFKFEEAAIANGDIEMANESNLTKISDLEFQLEEFKIRTEGLSSSLLELTEELTKTNEENASMRDLLEHANEKRTLLEGEESKSIELVQSLQIKLEESNELLKKQQGESLKELETLNTRLTRQLSEQEVANFKYNKDMEDAKIKYDTDVGARDEEIKSLKQELGETGVSLEKVVKELELFKFETQANDASLKKELDRCRMEMSAKVLEIETLSDGLKAKEEEIVSGESKFRKLQEEFEKIKKSSRDIEDELRAEIQTGKETLLLKDSELKQLLESKLGLEQSKDEIQNSNLRRLKETEDELKIVKANLEGKLGELEKSNARVKDLEVDVSEKEKVKVELEAKLKEFEGRFNQELEASKLKIGELELSIGDYQRKLQQSESKVEEVVKLKSGLEEEIKKLYGSTGEDSARLEALNAQVREKEASLEKTRDEFNAKLQETQHSLQQKEIELQSVVEKSKKDMEIIDGKLKELQEKLRVGQEEFGGVNEEKVKLLDDLEEVKNQLKDKDAQLEKVLGDLKSSESKRESILKSGKGESEKLSGEMENLKKQLEESQVKIKHFEGENVDLAVKLVQSTAELQETKDVLQKASTDYLEMIKNEKLISAQKDAQLEELKVMQQKELDCVKKDFEAKLLEFETNLQKTLGDDQSKSARIKELESQLDLTKNDVNSNLVTMETKQQEIVKLASDLQEAARLVDGLKREKEELLVAKQKVEAEVASGMNRMNVLTENVEQYSADLGLLNEERISYLQILTTMRLTERQKNELSAKVRGEECKELLKMVTVEKDESLEWQKRLKEVTEALEKTTRQNAQAQNDISNLQNQLSNQQQQQQNQNKRIELPQQTDANIATNNNTVSNDYKQLLEEKLFAESQVEFLNSIIVDMQKKNEEQKARLEILELGYSPSDADELKILEVRKFPPRMYCDICEEFDRHETDDCPQQGNDDLPSFSKSQKLKETEPERPYCEICEVFGHMTEDCQEDQTF